MNAPDYRGPSSKSSPTRPNRPSPITRDGIYQGYAGVLKGTGP